jgi:hypothetical protein
MSRFARWFRGSFSSASTRPAKARPRLRQRPSVECLEDRMVPTVTYLPQFGPQPTSDGHGLKLNDVPVFLIFKGSFWNNPTPGQPTATDVTNAVSSILNGPYLQSVTQYGVNGKAHLAGTFFDFTNPPTNFSVSQLQDIVENAQDHGIPESDDLDREPLYVVVTAPGVQSGEGGAASYNVMGHDYDFPFDYDDVPMIWLGGITPNGLPADHNTLDIYSDNFSHELAEAVTDINNDGITVSASTAFRQAFGNDQTGSQIGDNEADQNTYRVNNVLVQSLWSNAAQAYVVTDGNFQNVFVSNHVLTINDDQEFNHNDSIFVGRNFRGGVSVTLNGESYNFDPGQVTKVIVNTHTGTDQISLDGAPVPVEVNLGNDIATVTVGNAAHVLSAFSSPVTVHGGLGTGTLIVNDQDNPLPTTYTVSTGFITSSVQLGGSIGYDHLDQVVLNGGFGTDVTNLESTSTATAFNAGSGTNSIFVSPFARNLDNIGTLSIDGGTGVANVVIDDQNNANPPTLPIVLRTTTNYTLTANSLTRFEHPIFILPGFPSLGRTATIHFNRLDSLTINTGKTGNFDDLQGFPAPTTLNAGSADAITLHAFGPLTVDANGGTLTLDDSATKNFQNIFTSTTHNVAFTLTDKAVTRTDHVHTVTRPLLTPVIPVTTLAPVNLVTPVTPVAPVAPLPPVNPDLILDRIFTATINYKNVSRLSLTGGPVATAFNVQSTAAGTPVSINAGTPSRWPTMARSRPFAAP